MKLAGFFLLNEMGNVFVVEAMLGLVSPLLGLPQFVNGDGKSIN